MTNHRVRFGVDQDQLKKLAHLPERWRVRLAAQLRTLTPYVGEGVSQEYTDLCAMIGELAASLVPIDATDAYLCVMAERCAGECSTLMNETNLDALLKNDKELARVRMEQICKGRGIAPPKERDDNQAMRRMMDGAWWRKRLRQLHGRTLERAAQRLGLVSVRAGSYCSHETVKRRGEQIARNVEAMKGQLIRNENGQVYSVHDLAAKGMGNKTLRKGELMLRMAGCEDVAVELGHVGLFVTLTCPSRFHAVLQKTGTMNPKYLRAGAPCPRQAQAYLNSVWARTRAQNARDGIAPYGFRIAEPHHDGCPHWHMLVFVPRSQAATFARNLGTYANAMDADELCSKSALDARLKIVEIDPAKGTAAGYIAKYVGKNIDDSQGDAHDDEGAAMLDPNGEAIQTACARVDAWAAVWGIRQFQGLGMPPVTVWRELRRVAELANDAPEYMQRAHWASRRIEGEGPTMDGKPLVLKAAHFGEYIKAQGGVNVGRDYRIAIAYDPEVLFTGDRYGGLVDAFIPVGVYARQVPGIVYQSTRYYWERVGVAAVVDVRGCFPWSPLNNCTGPGPHLAKFGPVRPAWWSDEVENLPEYDDGEWFGCEEYEKNFVPPMRAAEEWAAAELAADEVRANTVWTVLVSQMNAAELAAYKSQTGDFNV